MKIIHTAFFKDKPIRVTIFEDLEEAFEFFEDGVAVAEKHEHSTLMSIYDEADNVGEVSEFMTSAKLKLLRKQSQ